ncbi:Flavin-linked sulfhydryl oxidase of the mitochondrial IMS [Microbotryomycetes sp. JL221]|nr:Flavin-linked sulfhydryl oxidase of the mitochondrial IMS [Microbotryomycetes sp. JL221]
MGLEERPQASTSSSSSAKLPPGIVLGPDGKPCKVCTGFKAWTGNMGKKKQTSSNSQGSSPPPTSSAAIAAAGAAAATTSATSAVELPQDCPADVERLGRHTWTFLHTTASYYPIEPTKAHESSMLGLLHALPKLYPCSSCADELGDYIKQHPPEQAVKQGRTALEQWMCQVHNDVNQRLGKQDFNCDNVAQRWRDGWSDGHCD